MPRKALNTAQKEYIISQRLLKSSRYIGKDIGFSCSCVLKFLRESNLSIPVEQINKFRAQKRTGFTVFTPEQDQYLKDNYLKEPIKAIAKKLKISHGCVFRRLERLNLHVPEQLAAARKEAGQFKPGQASHNKGKKLIDYMAPDKIKKVKKSQFKKGNLPHNTIFDENAISRRVDSKTGRVYLYKKIDHGKWVLLNRYIWEQANGPIPPNKLIIMKNGNSEDCRLENLEAITKRKNAIRNKETFNNYPEELKTAIKLNNRLIKTTKI